jgi:predicted GNAT family acetyltransferase
MLAMRIIHEESNYRGAFKIYDDDQQVGEMVYSSFGEDGFIIEHTEVTPSKEHQGFGLMLLADAVAFARAKGLKVVPLCPFAKAQFERHADFADVWYQR